MIRFFRHYLPLNVVLLVLIEFALFAGALHVGTWLRFHQAGEDAALARLPLTAQSVAFSGVMVTVMLALGLYDYWGWEQGFRGMTLRLGASFVVGFIAMSLLFYVAPQLLLGRGAFALSFLAAMVAVTGTRILFFRWSDLDILKRRVLVLGTGSRAAKIGLLLKSGSAAARGLSIVGYLPLKGAHHYVDASQILPDKGPLPAIVEKYKIDEIILSVRERRGGGLPMQELLDCKLLGVEIVELSTFFERQTGRLQLESLSAAWMVLSEGFRSGLARELVKRTFDLCAALALLVAALPIMALTAAAVLLESEGPVLYRQERVGQDGHVFEVLKFRSMQVDAERDGPRWAGEKDPRITRVGRLIRKARIDELPQIFNVLRGDMSLVGPRPERPVFVHALAREIPYYGCRHALKPGITGWAQIRADYGASVEESLEKLQYDLYYVKNHSFFLDLMILFQTAQVVLSGKGAR
ncbi:MAG: TIGR03013 family PEP-CTERM/XrtA system glycosyltransferase [Betaproteobacteria bacterium]|nr:TIGR03013 family PEP-CTERM/XrtA system glycosyltransferase [Betaproteobacteria bacterium]